MENVVLLDESGNPIGVHPKSTVHTLETPLHLAFSCYVFNPAGDVLITRRALGKVTWPGVWTNSCCGHPGPGEPLDEAILRRLDTELGIAGDSVRLVLPRFRYRATMDNGLVENEICPVFTVLYDGIAPDPNPDEVDSLQWVPWTEFSRDVLARRRPISPWCADQVAALSELGPDPLGWPTASSATLPPAARTGVGSA